MAVVVAQAHQGAGVLTHADGIHVPVPIGLGHQCPDVIHTVGIAEGNVQGALRRIHLPGDVGAPVRKGHQVTGVQAAPSPVVIAHHRPDAVRVLPPQHVAGMLQHQPDAPNAGLGSRGEGYEPEAEPERLGPAVGVSREGDHQGVPQRRQLEVTCVTEGDLGLNTEIHACLPYLLTLPAPAHCTAPRSAAQSGSGRSGCDDSVGSPPR